MRALLLLAEVAVVAYPDYLIDLYYHSGIATTEAWPSFGGGEEIKARVVYWGFAGQFAA